MRGFSFFVFVVPWVSSLFWYVSLVYYYLCILAFLVSDSFFVICAKCIDLWAIYEKIYSDSIRAILRIETIHRILQRLRYQPCVIIPFHVYHISGHIMFRLIASSLFFQPFYFPCLIFFQTNFLLVTAALPSLLSPFRIPWKRERSTVWEAIYT